MVTIADIIVEPPAPGVVVRPASWFDADGPVELEIGCGKGGFLLDRARRFPQNHLIGIEWANKYFRYAADRMARWDIENVRVMRTDAAHFVANHLPPSCLSALHIYHPDPWPKKRHHKRRLFQPAFVAAAVRALAPGAHWAIQTDHAEYFQLIRSLVGGQSALDEESFDQTGFGTDDALTNTNFEIKYLREGRAIHRLAFRKHA